MSSLLAFFHIWALLQLLLGNQLLCFGCHHKEKETLLYLKASANSTSLDSWRKEEDCCSWESVQCNNVTRRITHLRLHFINNHDQNWDLNFSIFASLGELYHLDLLGNNIVGSLASKDLLALKNVELLDLSFNSFTGSLPSNLTSLTNLRGLNLGNNIFTGDISNEAFPGLIHLRKLYLDGNDLSGEFSFVSSFANNTRLEFVDFSYNRGLNIQFDQKLFWTPQFQLLHLDMSDCNLQQNFISVHNFLSSQYDIEYMDFSNNKLQGSLTHLFFQNKTKLHIIYLANNLLVGSLNLTTLHNVESMSMDLSSNSFDTLVLPTIQRALFSTLDLSHNSFAGSIPPSICNIVWSRDIGGSLDLSNNNFGGEIPSCLMTNSSNLQYLEHLALSNNKLTGNFYSAYNASPNLQVLYLDGNMLTGNFPSNLSVHPYLTYLDISDNNLSGSLPEFIGEMYNLVILKIRGNSFQGTLPFQLCNLTNLIFLDLSNNNFSGLPPNCSETFSELRILNLSINAFEGDFSEMPVSFFGIPNITILDVSGNNLSGRIDRVCDLNKISVLLYSRNSFQGSLMAKCCELQDLRLLDLSHNNLSGPIPACLGRLSLQKEADFELFPDYLMPTSFEFNTKGNYYLYNGPLKDLMIGFDLSNNNFSGKIPPELGNLTLAKSLNLSYNQLTGSIPETFSKLTEIESLDLSHNQLTGPIPKSFVLLKSLEFFSVAYNNLSGSIPDFKDQFGTFNCSSYIGNPNLHGRSLDETCSSVKAAPNSTEEYKDEEDDDDIDDAIMYAIAAASFVLAFWACMFCLYWTMIGWRIRVKFIDPYVDSFF